MAPRAELWTIAYYTCSEDHAVTGYAGFGPPPEDPVLVRNGRAFTLSYTPPAIPEWAVYGGMTFFDPFVVCPSGNWILDPSYDGVIPIIQGAWFNAVLSAEFENVTPSS